MSVSHISSTINIFHPILLAKKIVRIASSLAISLTLGLAGNTASADDTKHQFNIQTATVSEALQEFAVQANAEILFSSEIAKDKQTEGLQGEYTNQEALQKLLEGTGLSVEKTSSHVFLVQADPNQIYQEEKGGKKKTLSHSAQTLENKASSVYEEIFVTANKRTQNLQDTAMALSVLTNTTIDRKSLVGMSDYLPALPGISMQERSATQNSIVIRGITSDPQVEASNVGVYFGETPVTNLGSGSIGDLGGSADIKLVDIEQIEILRGPQGTLYGSSSMGGAVRVLPVSPNLEVVEGKLATRFSHTGKQGGNNTMVQGVINLPLIEDVLAIRGVAYRFDNSGYIDNVAASQSSALPANALTQGGIAQDRSDVGNDETAGVRVSTLWQPTDQLNMTLTYFHQETEQDGKPDVEINLPGKFQQARFRTGVDGNSNEGVKNELDLASLEIGYGFSWGNLVSASSWIDYDTPSELDWSFSSFHGNSPWSAVNNASQEMLTQEFRLASKFEGPLQFLAGIYYEDRKRKRSQNAPWGGSQSLDPGFELIPFVGKIEQTEKARFGELSYDISKQVNISAGVRHFRYDRTEIWDIDFSGSDFLNEKLTADADDKIYKVNASYQPNDGTLFYTQWSEGFRLGAAVSQFFATVCDAEGDIGTSFPTQIDPDNTKSFELGLKLSMADNRITVNTAIYRINWKGIPVEIPLPSCSSSVPLNAGKAKSEGIELELKAHPIDNLLLYLSASYGEAVLTEDLPNLDPTVFGGDGDNLPGSADFNFSTAVEYGFTLMDYPAFIRADYAYVGEYSHNLPETGPMSGDYHQANLKTGVTISQVDIELFVTNLTNADDFTWVENFNTVGTNLRRAYRLRPRTVGLSIAYIF